MPCSGSLVFGTRDGGPFTPETPTSGANGFFASSRAITGGVVATAATEPLDEPTFAVVGTEAVAAPSFAGIDVDPVAVATGIEPVGRSARAGGGGGRGRADSSRLGTGVDEAAASTTIASSSALRAADPGGGGGAVVVFARRGASGGAVGSGFGVGGLSTDHPDARSAIRPFVASPRRRRVRSSSDTRARYHARVFLEDFRPGGTANSVDTRCHWR
ncbi:MAG: hypothetical protein KIT31_20210 [Deltaproteobacteria bacterium]|nr:hypothetical protein [Deltaproteobacteria bacterium]